MSNAAASTAFPSPRRGAPRAVILVVDDDGAMCDLLKEELEHEGFAVEVAQSGRAGVERVKRGGIDLVARRKEGLALSPPAD